MVRRIKGKSLTLFTMGYLYVPFFMFLFTWTRLYIAIPTALIGLGAILYVYRNTEDEEYVQFRIPVLAIYFAVMLGISVYTGWGGLLSQHYDWYKHNAVLSDLIEYDYPVYYQNGSEESMLTYYIGVYIVPGLFGKIVGFRMAHLLMCGELWGFGILLYLNILRLAKPDSLKREALVAGGCLFFNYPMILMTFMRFLYQNREGIEFGRIAAIVENEIGAAREYDVILEIRGMYIAYASFPAYLPIAVITILFVRYKEKLNMYIAIWIPALLYCVMALPYIILLAAILFFVGLKKENRNGVRRAILINGLALMGVVPIILYYIGNILGDKDAGIGLAIQCIGENFGIALLFFSLVIVPYLVLAYKTNKGDLIFYLDAVLLFLSMFLTMGRFNDLLITGTIPLSVILMIAICKTLSDDKVCKKQKVIICLMFAIASFPLAFFEKKVTITREDQVIENTDNRYDTVKWLKDGFVTYGSMVQFADRASNHESDLKYNYFTYDYKDSLFYKYIARK